ncbi:MAG TPA: hypothetical protein VFG10_03370 [Saprospiraceae bacterium]|nr:hypothetical protein [Saprospiraceae bacterium]
MKTLFVDSFTDQKFKGNPAAVLQTFLTKYWVEKLKKSKLKAFHSSLRTGCMTTELIEGKVLIYGEAVTVLEGEFIC